MVNDPILAALIAKSGGGGDYLPLAGGTMTGQLNVSGAGAYVKNSLTTATASSDNLPVSAATNTTESLNTLTTLMPTLRTYLGSVKSNNAWYNVLSTRHGNGVGDGTNFGMLVYSKMQTQGDLLWRQQTGADTWSEVRTILDSNNYTNYCAPKSALADSGWVDLPLNAEFVRRGSIKIRSLCGVTYLKIRSLIFNDAPHGWLQITTVPENFSEQFAVPDSAGCACLSMDISYNYNPAVFGIQLQNGNVVLQVIDGASGTYSGDATFPPL